MRSIIFTLSLLLSLYCRAQTTVGELELVLEDMRKQEASWNNGDINGFMEYYWKNDSLKFIGTSGITYGWQQTIGKYLKSYPTKEAMGTLRFSIIEALQLSPTSIYMVGRWELQKEKPASGHFSLLWRKIDGKWLIVTDHTS